MKVSMLLSERKALLQKVALAEYVKSSLDKLSRTQGGIDTEDAGRVGGEMVLEFLADIDANLVYPMLKRVEEIEGLEVGDEQQVSKAVGGDGGKKASKKRHSKSSSRKD